MFFAKGIACLGYFRGSALSFPPNLSSGRKSWFGGRGSSAVSGSGRSWCFFCMKTPNSPIPPRPMKSGCRTNVFASGGDAGMVATCRWKIARVRAARPAFPPSEQSQVKAIACEAVAQTGAPLSRQSAADVTRRVRDALGRAVSRSSVWRILHRAAIKPWQYRYWIFPRDPDFAAKAQRVLDLYARSWFGERLRDDEYVISSDEKTSIQARLRIHSSRPPQPGGASKIEFEYRRGGALQYLAAWDVHRGVVMGRSETHTGMAPFMRLVEQVMSQEPYRSAKRVFWIVDNGSSHRGARAQERLKKRFPNATLVHTPVHASWLNQVEIYFSIVQRKVLTPNDAASLTELAERLRRFEELNNQNPQPFDWRFDRSRLHSFLRRFERQGFHNLSARLPVAA